jgi:hypothetical protein
VRRERIEPAYKVEVVSDEVAIRGEVEDPLAGNGGCSTKTDRNKAM